MLIHDSLYVLAALCLIVAVSEWLVRRTALHHIGTALLVILVTALLANLRLLPAGSSAQAPVPVYEAIFGYVAPLAIFWLLLPVSLRDILRAGLPIIALFLIGAAGIVVGAVLGLRLFGGMRELGPLYGPVGGMFVATYTGGSINFNAVALGYDVVRHGTLYAGTVAVDNVITAVWMVATLALPRLLLPLWAPARVPKAAVSVPAPVPAGEDPPATAAEDPPEPEATPAIRDEAPEADPPEPGTSPASHDEERVDPLDLGLVLALGLAAVLLADRSATWLERLGYAVPSILILTVFALVLAQVPWVARLRGVKLIGMFAVYLFLAVIGAYCDLGRLVGLGRLGLVLLGFAGTLVLVHGIVTFVAARLLRIDPDTAAVASQANVGGSTSALALARSLGRDDLVLPGVLVGALGNALGTFIGFWAAARLL